MPGPAAWKSATGNTAMRNALDSWGKGWRRRSQTTDIQIAVAASSMTEIRYGNGNALSASWQQGH
jgi:hypothetical protein